ncbi:MAG: SRPBCC domain-containing protein [Hyphomicrobium sp.]|nr:SRPBCC domain-containing protein [Hyphomicrobium sp.]
MTATSAAGCRAKTLDITRVFKAPRARVWQAWTTADDLENWWGPKGCKLKVADMDFRPGGFFHYEMKFTNTPSMWGRFMYREIINGSRIVWLNSFANERGGIARAPFAADFPLEVHNTVTFANSDGSTIVALQSLPFGATDGEIQAFEAIYDNMIKGYGATLDQLEAYLAS